MKTLDSVPDKCTIVLDNPYSEWFYSKPDGVGPIVQGQGYAFVGSKYVEGQDLVDFVKAQSCVVPSPRAVEKVKDLIPGLNGAWALVIRWPDGHLLAASDRVRSIPLFYSLLPGEFIVASSVESILSRFESAEIDQTCAMEFLLAGYVTGNETLWKDIHQIQPGEIIEYSGHDGKAELSATRYYRFLPSRYSTATESQLEEELESVLDMVFSRFVSALNGKKVIVPLSGGLDSRLIVAQLKRQGFEDVLCFTYGRRGNEESTISREVSNALGYEWRFFEYDGHVWAKLINSEVMTEYWKYIVNGSCLSNQSDLPALRMLFDDCSDERDAAFLPGHTGDFLSGGHIRWELVDVPEKATDKLVLEQHILRRHYDLWPIEMKRFRSPYLTPLVDKITQLTAVNGYGHQASNPVARYEMWDAECRQAHFIVSSVRAYEFMGSDWKIPLWDYELMDFFINILPMFRIQERLYTNTLRERVFTGKAKDLANIPVAGVGNWDTRVSGSRPLKAYVREAMRAFGLLDAIRELRPRKQRSFEHYLAFETWFANGRDPRSLTVKDALRPYHVLEHLPSTVVSLLEPSLEKRLDLVSHNGLQSAVLLAGYYSQFPGPEA